MNKELPERIIGDLKAYSGVPIEIYISFNSQQFASTPACTHSYILYMYTLHKIHSKGQVLWSYIELNSMIYYSISLIRL